MNNSSGGGTKTKQTQGFETYAIKSWCVENLVFWLDVQSFKANVAQEDMSPADKLKQAKRIFFTYIVEGAELNVRLFAFTPAN